MFERRLKIFLILVAAMVLVLMGRAAQVQIIHRGYWKSQAAEAMKRTHLVDTSRGAVADRKGNVLAIDKPCVDACVDYCALTSPPDGEWVKQRALERLKSRLGDGWTKLSRRQKIESREQEILAVVADIDRMWPRLAEISGRPLESIEESRDAIVHRVEMRQRFVWNKRYEEAIKKGGNNLEATQWKRWVSSGGDDGPAIDQFNVTVSEQLEPHVILPAVDLATQNALGKDIDRYPGLILRPGTHRAYPYGDVACHLLGHLARVDGDDLKANRKEDELREYLPNDLIGKTGVEALCEPALHGKRGKIDRVLGEETVLASQEPTPGQDVRLTLDIDLQQQIQAAFEGASLRDSNGKVVETDVVLHGAAVVLDVATNQVLAMVSYPTYDLNQLDELYVKLRDDEINDPLRNRATMSQLEPGSTVKLLCGLAGISEGVIGVNEGIECTGFLRLDGHVVPGGGRCWVESKFGKFLRERGMTSAHHPIPFLHVGHDGNPNGFLTYSDALERSCNVYFETVADRLGIERLSNFYEKVGLGRPTGVGIGEAKGRLPKNFPSSVPALRRSMGFFGGIGQGYVAATPIQMANAASMIARDGIWMRPILVMNGPDGKLPPLRDGASQNMLDRIDLHLPPEALAAAKLGMFNVVNGRAGTGKALVAGDKLLQDLMICGKTGTAQAARFSLIVRDGAGKPVYDEFGHVKREFLEPSTPGHPNPIAPWYRTADAEGKDLNHAWYIGFAPAEHPKIAFAVMVEYGGSGGVAAASIAREALEASMTQGYLQAPRPVESTTQPAVAGGG